MPGSYRSYRHSVALFAFSLDRVAIGVVGAVAALVATTVPATQVIRGGENKQRTVEVVFAFLREGRGWLVNR